MTNATTVLNSVLYRCLQRRFGDVKVRNQGEARIVRPDPHSDESKLVVQQWGETYSVRCPFCDDSCSQLSISYMYGQRDEYSDRQLTNLVYCHHRKCLARYENQRKLADMLRSDALEEARILPGKRVSDDQRVIELPSPVTRLDELTPGHLAQRLLAYRGFNPVRLGRYYQLSYCDESDDPLTRESIIIPIVMRDVLRGWQVLPLRHLKSASDNNGTSFKYLSARGMHNGRLLYNIDRARQYETGILVREPRDVWAFGPMSVSPVGNTLSDFQARQLLAVFRRRTAVVVMEKKEPPGSAIRKLAETLTRRMPGRLAVVEIPPDLPPGSDGRKELRAHVAKEAKGQGISVSYAKCP